VLKSRGAARRRDPVGAPLSRLKSRDYSALIVRLPEENIQKGDAVPLKRLKDEYLEQDGVRFLMEDEAGNTVTCRVSHEALRNHADRMHISGTDAAVFETCRELIEEVASEAHDAEGPFDAQGRVLVTSEALARVTRSA
jgi:hypothetical protein